MAKQLLSLLTIVAFLQISLACYNYVCSDRFKTCTKKQGDNVYINSGACAPDEECYISEDDSESHCMKKLDTDFPTFLYPGYKCSFGNPGAQCTFGPKYCKNDGICAGVQLYDTCTYNTECYFGMYCNEGGRCVKYKELGERCSTNEACGRKAMCIFETTLSTYGTCKEILTMSDNTLVLPMYKQDMAETDSNIFVYQQDYEKVCRSGYLNNTSGRCMQGLKSKNKGGVCMSDLDCPTTDPSIFAKCKCGHTSKGTKYCDIEGGDDEWLEANDLFEQYFERSYDCHAGEGFGECNNNIYFSDWKCAVAKAKLFVDLINMPSCLQDIMGTHPLYYDYFKYCNARWFVGLLSTAIISLTLFLIY